MKKKIIDAFYVFAFIVGIAFLIWFMADKNFWLLLAGLGSWGLIPIVDETMKKHGVSNDEEKKTSE